MKRLFLGTIIAGTAIFAILGIFFAACGSTPPVGGGTGAAVSGGGAPVLKLDGGPNGQAGSGGGAGSAGPPPTGDANCGTQTSGTSRQPADVLLVLDRSGSMTNSTSADSNCAAGSTTCSARWPALTSAVNATLTSTASSINWGLKLFSSTGNACGVNNGVEIAISATSVPAINTLIGTTKPGGNTPTAQAITAATAYLKTLTDTNSKYILLATDGEPNCAPGNNTTPNVQATVDAITAAKNAGFLVYVIGIGPQAALTNLQSFAVAGGTTNYFPATSPQALADAFTTISTAVTTCTFALAQTPPDPTNIAVYLDGNLLTKDDPNGWSFGGNSQTVVIGGTSCDAITAGTATKVQVLFGCAGGPPPPTTLF
jgi:hypothetical protein